MTLLWASILAPFLLYLTMIMIDPYDNLPVSPPWRRLQVSGTQRYFKPSVAKRPHYDSIIVGTSSSMLLHPVRLGKRLNSRFASLAMPAASPFEQLRLMKLFRQHHQQVDYVVIGMDEVWCLKDGSDKLLGANAGNRIPDWLYDENRWNDWPRFSSQLLKYTDREFRALLDPNRDAAGHDGYYDFTTEHYGDYDPDKVRKKLYNGQSPIPRVNFAKAQEIAEKIRGAWAFPDLIGLQNVLADYPEETVKILVFMPYHWNKQPQPGSIEQAYLAVCKRRTAAMGSSLSNVYVIDFMNYTPLTLTDANYWDPIHYTIPIAKYIETVILKTMMGNHLQDRNFVYLSKPAVSAKSEQSQN